jgi:hypothetical protein
MLLINHTLPVMLGLLSNSLSKATIHWIYGSGIV